MGQLIKSIKKIMNYNKWPKKNYIGELKLMQINNLI